MQDAYVYIHLLVYKSGRLMEASQISFQFVHEQRYVSRYIRLDYMTGLKGTLAYLLGCRGYAFDLKERHRKGTFADPQRVHPRCCHRRLLRPHHQSGASWPPSFARWTGPISSIISICREACVYVRICKDG